MNMQDGLLYNYDSPQKLSLNLLLPGQDRDKLSGQVATENRQHVDHLNEKSGAQRPLVLLRSGYTKDVHKSACLLMDWTEFEKYVLNDKDNLVYMSSKLVKNLVDKIQETPSMETIISTDYYLTEVLKVYQTSETNNKKERLHRILLRKVDLYGLQQLVETYRRLPDKDTFEAVKNYLKKADQKISVTYKLGTYNTVTKQATESFGQYRNHLHKLVTELEDEHFQAHYKSWRAMFVADDFPPYKSENPFNITIYNNAGHPANMHMSTVNEDLFKTYNASLPKEDQDAMERYVYTVNNVGVEALALEYN